MAQPFSGKNNFALVGIETDFGTKVSATKDIGLLQSSNPTATNNVEQVYALGTRLAQQIIANGFSGAIDIEYFYQHGRMFRFVTGNDASDTSSSSDYLHTFVDEGNTKPVAETIPSFTYEDNYNSTSDEINSYISCKVATTVISLDVNGKLTVRLSCPYQSTDNETLGTQVTSTLPVLPHFYGALSVGTEGSETELTQVQSCEITLENTLIQIDALGTRLTQENIANDFKASYRFTLVFQDNTQFELFKGSATTPASGTPTKFGLTLEVDNGIAYGSGKVGLNIELRDSLHGEWSQPISIGGVIIAEFTGESRQLYKLQSWDTIADYFS